MIVNQGVQIYNDAMEKITMNGQLTELAGSILAPKRVKPLARSGR